MKAISKTIILASLFLLPLVSFSQTIKTSFYSAYKLSSKGGAVGVQLPGFIGDMEFGVFYESFATSSFQTESGISDRSTTETKGVYSFFSLVSVPRWDVSLGAKVGTAGEGLVMSPELRLDHYLTDYFGLGASSKLEIMKHVFQARVFFNVFGASERQHRLKKYKRNKSYFKALRGRNY